MAHRALPAHHATIIDQADLMNLARPVDADIPVEHLTHRRAPIHMGRRSLDPPLYWRSLSADSPLGLSRGLPPGHASPQVFATQGAKGCSRRTGPISQRRYSTADRLTREGYRGRQDWDTRKPYAARHRVTWWLNVARQSG